MFDGLIIWEFIAPSAPHPPAFSLVLFFFLTPCFFLTPTRCWEIPAFSGMQTDRTCSAPVWELLGFLIPKYPVLNGSKGSLGLARLFGTCFGSHQLPLMH